MKFSGRRTYSRHFSFLPFLFVLANRFRALLCNAQKKKAETKKLISEGLTKQPRTRSELQCGEGRRGGESVQLMKSRIRKLIYQRQWVIYSKRTSKIMQHKGEEKQRNRIIEEHMTI